MHVLTERLFITGIIVMAYSTCNTSVTSTVNADICQITEVNSITAVVNLPYGKKLQLVQDGHIPVNICNYMRDNFEDIVRRLSGDQLEDAWNSLHDKRVLVYADGTLELANQIPTPPNDTTLEPSVFPPFPSVFPPLSTGYSLFEARESTDARTVNNTSDTAIVIDSDDDEGLTMTWYQRLSTPRVSRHSRRYRRKKYKNGLTKS